MGNKMYILLKLVQFTLTGTDVSVLLIVGWSVCWWHCMLPPGESRWASQWNRQTDRHQTIM